MIYRKINSFIILIKRRGVKYLYYLAFHWLFMRISKYIILKLLEYKHLKYYVFIISYIINFFILSLLFSVSVSLIISLAIPIISITIIYIFSYTKLMHQQKYAQHLHNQNIHNSNVQNYNIYELSDLFNDKNTIDMIVSKFNSKNSEILLGSIDRYLRVYSLYGNMNIPFQQIKLEEFVPRKRFNVDIVYINGSVAIKKCFKNNLNSFVKDWLATELLLEKVNVPRIIYVDKKQRILYKSFIKGKILRDYLLEIVNNNSFYSIYNISRMDNQNKFTSIPGLLELALPSRFWKILDRQINQAHSLGITDFIPTVGNIIIDDNFTPWLIDFDGCQIFKTKNNPLFWVRRNRDIQKYNKSFRRELPTEQKLKQKLRQILNKGPWYAPIDFGYGFTIGSFWSTDTGTGRWDYLNSKILLPLIKGKRILDLGSNNGLLPLLMLRAGAKEVIGIELDSNNIEKALLVKAIFEWIDMRPYNFTIIKDDMRSLIHKEFGQFDIVTAFCSLYYLDESDISKLIKHCSLISSLMICQANVHVRPQSVEKKIKASVTFLKSKLEENGFPYVEIHAPKGFSRPLLIGKKKS